MKGLLKSKLYLSLIGVIAVFLLAVVYIFAVVLDTPLLSSSKKVTVNLVSTGGLYKGSPVTYRGVNVGKVTTIDLTQSGVKARIRLNTSKEIPASSKARVRSLSPVGEQYLDLQPTSTKGPYLKDGGEIAASSTDVPKTLASTVVAIKGLLNQIDADQLHTILNETAIALKGTGDDINRTIDQGQLVLDDVEANWPATDRLLHNGGEVLDIGTQNDARITAFAKDSRQFAAFLKAYNPELVKTLHAAPGQIQTVDAMTNDVAKQLPGFLGSATAITDVFAKHDPHLRALLAGYTPGLGALADTIRNNTLQIELFVRQDVPCQYGRTQASGNDAPSARRAMPRDLGCAGSYAKDQRGAAHAPGPTR